MLLRLIINVKPQQHKPNFMIKGVRSMIPTIIVSHKRDTHIAKGMRATMNKSTSIMKIVEPDIHLTEGTGLDSLKGNPLFITQEVLKHIPNARKRYLMIQQRFDYRNGQVTLPSVRQFHHHVRHQLTLINLDSLKPLGMNGLGSMKWKAISEL